VTNEEVEKMGLAFDAIEPVVYPVAMQLLQSGMKGYHVAARIFKQFGKQYDVPNNETNTAMIYLSVTCAENDFLKKEKYNSISENE
jgi:hypothetical protein